MRRLGVFLALVVIGSGVMGCSSSDDAQKKPAPVAWPRASFADLRGWRTAALQPALAAFLRSCTQWSDWDATAWMHPRYPVFGRMDRWQDACAKARAVPRDRPGAARRFFEAHFRPHYIKHNGTRRGLFTGYFEPQLSGARTRQPGFAQPLYRPPRDLVEVVVGRFVPGVDETIFGRVVEGQLVPHFSRAAIDRGALKGRNLELLWVDSAVDAFFLHIQGSGRVLLRDSTVVRVGYAAENGHPYRAIGRDLIAMGALTQANVSLQTIRAWLLSHPARADDVMHQNASYVFFRVLKQLGPNEGPLGAQGVPLTPRHSLAVDPDYLPYGAPLWLDTRVPRADTSGQRAFRQLLIAQDTGGAIQGPIRGDVFWGAGKRARAIAGRMNSTGRYTVLIPIDTP
ncbi:murein transglycosylase A [Salisaeta longa]|uniref:murein transglycosylase A n=1 Tax=Salisaeta longa TaxID=503170 RepID=UPI0003B2EB00|nr:murein transglycosylase A [Salisaeta longa]